MFPEGKELSEKDTKLKKEIEDLITKMNNTTPSNRKINESQKKFCVKIYL